MTAKINLQNLANLASKASAGPWEASTEDGASITYIYSDSHLDAHIRSHRPEADAKFIAACDPQTILTLIHAIRLLATTKDVHFPDIREVLESIDLETSDS